MHFLRVSARQGLHILHTVLLSGLVLFSYILLFDLIIYILTADNYVLLLLLLLLLHTSMYYFVALEVAVIES